MKSRLVVALLALLPTHAFRAHHMRAAPHVRPGVALCAPRCTPCSPLLPTSAAAAAVTQSRSRRVSGVRMLGGGFNGGFLNLGAPEVIVIGAVAWAVLGPKELFRIAKQAGEFIGEWQQLGQQAKDQFTSALETELAEDEATKAAAAPPPPTWGETQPAAPAEATMASEPVGAGASSIPPLADYAAARNDERAKGLTADEESALRESMFETLGEPTANQANFAEQISGARNAAVLTEYPDELSADDPPMPGADGSPLDVQTAEEMLLTNQIEETENELQTLRAEKRVLALKRQQLEQNAARANRMAEERALGEEAGGEDEAKGAEVSA